MHLHRRNGWLRYACFLVISVVLVSFTACGGSGSSTPPPPAISVSVSPSTPSVGVGQNQTFTAIVSNTTNTSVNWSISEGANGGNITSAGVYTAPMKAGTYHVVATSQADPTKTGQAAITVTAPAPTISTTPPTSASEGVIYSYTVGATDPAGTAVTFQLTTAPIGATFSSNTLTWTPTSAQSRTSNSFVVIANSAAGGTAQQSWSISPSGTIRGTRIVSSVTDSGVVDNPDDTTAFPISAIYSDYSGTYHQAQGNGSTAGTFTIPAVPTGYYWLQHGQKNYFYTSTSNIDTGYSWLGRNDVAYSNAGTYLSLNLTGLNAWQSSDRLEWFVSNAGSFAEWWWPSYPIGSTTMSGNFGFATGTPLSSASSGDQAYISQLSTVDVNGFQLQFLSRVLGPTSVTTLNGGGTSVIGNLVAVPLTSTIRVNIKGSAFFGLQSSVNPNAVSTATYAYLSALPGSDKGFLTSSADLIMYENSNGPLENDLDLGDRQFGNPYPSSWGVVLSYEHIFNVSYLAPNATAPVNKQAVVLLYTTTLPSATSPLTPLVGPVSSPLVQGSNFFNDQYSVGTTPTISWSAPTVGTATGYVVVVYQLSADSSFNSQVASVASLYTTKTSIKLPPNLLLPGNTYVFDIVAYHRQGIDFETEPYRKSLPEAYAECLSGRITP